uniref:heme oxygenase (biliverdin-producing) n=1 Tax=Sphenodon punctatus TaxID=8508 RepID=A0A8D0H7P5_SPHPU
MKPAGTHSSESMPEDLSEALKKSTKDVHEQAETTEFMKNFQKGQVSLREFKMYMSSLYYIYSALEKESERNKDNPVYAPVYFPAELNRKHALEQDLEYFYGPTWRQEIQCYDATQKYVVRLQHVGQHEPELLVAHAYTRYLGDLSGGQVLKKIAQKALHLPSTGDGVAFFTFPGVSNITKFKQLYRARMNALPMDSATKQRIVEEARNSFLINIQVFEELQKLASQGRENGHPMQQQTELRARGTNQAHSTVPMKESERVQMKHSNILPSTSLIRWLLILGFLAITVAVGLYAM